MFQSQIRQAALRVTSAPAQAGVQIVGIGGQPLPQPAASMSPSPAVHAFWICRAMVARSRSAAWSSHPALRAARQNRDASTAAPSDF
jgi:hypothetical protein